jgi:two-component system sensor histidine kinase/response regulator
MSTMNFCLNNTPTAAHFSRFLISVCLLSVALGCISSCSKNKSSGKSAEELQACRDSVNSQISKLDTTGLNQAIEKYRKSGDSLGVALAWNSLGKKQRNASLFVKAINSHRTSVEASVPLRDTMLTAGLMIELSTDFRRTGSMTDASTTLFDALNLMEQYSGRNTQDGLKQKSYILNGLGNVYKTLDNGTEAERYFRQSLEIDTRLGNERGMAMNCSTLGNVYEHRLMLDSAERMYRSALEHDIKAKDNEGIAISYNRLGQLAMHRDSVDAAIAYHQKAYDILTSEKEVWNRMKAAMSLAWLYLVKHDLPKAYALLEESLEAAKVRNSFGHLEEIHYCLAEYYRQKGDFRSAYQEEALCIQARDSISKQRDQQQVAQSRVNYEREKNEIEVNKLNAENESVRANRHIIIVSGIIISCILIALLLLAFFAIKLQKRRNKELADMNAVKTKLFSIVSHDLKNPAIAQHRALSMLVAGLPSLSPDAVSAQCNAIEKTSETQLDLINNLLDWSRLQSGKMQYTPVRLSVASVVRQVLDQVEEMASAKEITIDTCIPAECFALTDKTMLTIVMRNLITNAIKFSNRGGEIRILVGNITADTAGFWRISVCDNGIGMSQETISNLFRIDNQHTSLGTEGEHGTGLGLVVCEEMVETNGGKITVDSTEGKGSTFSFTIKAA